MQAINPFALTNCNDNQLREMFVEASRDLARTAPHSAERTETLWAMEHIAAAMFSRGH
jgi:hypothetical protein